MTGDEKPTSPPPAYEEAAGPPAVTDVHSGPYTAVPSAPVQQEISQVAHGIPYQPPPQYGSRYATSEEDLEGQYGDADKPVVADAPLAERLAFVRKVYSILATMLLVTCGIAVGFRAVPTMRLWVLTHPWVLTVNLMASLVLLLVTVWKRLHHPTNLILLGFFTLSQSVTIGTVVSYYDSVTVLQAALITTGLFIGLTLFTFQSKRDFSGMGTYLGAGFFILILASLLQIFIPFSSGLSFIIAVGSCILFSAYIIYDTDQLIRRLSIDEYVVAVIDLYMDILNLFLAILRVLDHSSSD